MKKILFVIIILFVWVSAYGQNTYNKVYLDTNVYKIHNGIIYDTVHIFNYTEVDTIYIVNNGDTSGYTIDSTTYDAINICLGDSIRLCCYATYNGSLNHIEDSLSFITWDIGDGTVISEYSLVQHIYYNEVGCYDIAVSMTDQYNVVCNEIYNLRVRIAENPVKRIFDLGSICSTDSMLLNVGYGDDAFIMLKGVSFAESVTKEYAVKTFIPDGMNSCPTMCFTADVNFTEFPPNKTIMSADDICSVCINMEHSFMGDWRMSLVCPSGQKAVLKYGTRGYDQSIPSNAPDGSYGGSGQYVGIPYGGSSDGPYDNLQQNHCDSIYNMYGEGLEYCFSRNQDYTFVTGRLANSTTLITDDYIASTNDLYRIQYNNYQFQTIPAPYVNAGTTASPSTFRTKRPSDHDNKSDYYAPAEDFTNLIGCPLNGTWSIEVCDYWPADNGWVFSWNMDLCNANNSSCEYLVGIDSLVWYADDHLNFDYKDSLTAYISSSDTAGTFPMYLNIYDDFNCVWKDTVNINIVQTPEPNLGNDTSICASEILMINAADRHKEYHDTYQYMWDPYGNTNDTVIAHGDPGSSILYLVEVVNNKHDIKCRARDSIHVNINKQPVLSFDPGVYPLEGCEPFTLNFKNYSHDVERFRWDFGDNSISTDMDVKHSYKEGVYTLKCYGESIDGCKDSLIFDNVITVFSLPKSKFVWDPMFPSATNPYVVFNNQSSGSNNIYRWEIQYDKDYPYSYHTLTSENPFFAWTGNDLSGDYIVRLIVKTINRGPSGNLTACVDTSENKIVLVNDDIRFPNVVSPNGDGVNDRFVIINLLSGAFPVNRLDIYNRWGGLVYHVDNISKDEDFWDPNATKSPDGTYFFRFSAVGYTGKTERSGVIEVLR